MVPGAMIHEKQKQPYHEIAFKFLLKCIKQKGVPIATDDQAGIAHAAAIETELVRLGCYRDVRGDIQRWVDEMVGHKMM